MDPKLLVFCLFGIVTITWTYGDITCTDNVSCKKMFNYSINNQLVKPYFHQSMVMKLHRKRPLIRYMEESVLQNPKAFTGFTATFSSPYGYYIDSINGLAGNWAANKTYWKIFNSTGPLRVGVSSYIPSPGDQVLFNFTKGRH